MNYGAKIGIIIGLANKTSELFYNVSQLLRRKAAAGIVGAAVEVAVSAVAEDEGAAALGTNAGSYFAVGFVLGCIDVAHMGAVIDLIPDVLLD